MGFQVEALTSRSILLRIRTVSDKSYRENQNTHFVFNNFFFFRKSCLLWDNMEKTSYSRTGHRWQNGAFALHAG